jgi:alcohol dehydrogenase class IV
MPHSANYDFLAPPRIVFGWGRRNELGHLAKTLGRRAFVVCGSRTLAANGTLDQLQASLREADIAVESLGTISREPEVEDVDQFTGRLCEHQLRDGDLVLAIGGGSAMDLGKAVAAMATNRASPTVRDYLEGVGRGLKIEASPLPVLAMPTTAGTGSEATKNAVISSQDPPFKKSLRSDSMIPRAVLIDPELTAALPPKITAHTGMDAITQLIESYLSRRSTVMTRLLALKGLQIALVSITEAVREGRRGAREMMANAALLSGMSLANSGLGMAHGVAAALGVVCGVPHGLACAVMLPVALRANRNVALDDLAHLSRAVEIAVESDSADQAADEFIERIELLCQAIGIPRRLSEIGVERHVLPDLVRGSRGNSMSGNPREVSDDELHSILERML